MNETLANHATARSNLGSVGTLDDGRRYVVFQRRTLHPVKKVWAALTEPSRLADWFPDVALERCEGGTFEIWFGGHCEGPAHVSGIVTRHEPPHVLEMGSMRYEQAAMDDGCSLTLSDILWFEGPRSEIDIINSVLGGWHKHLDLLEFALNGGAGDPPDDAEFDYSQVRVQGRD